MLLYRDGSRWSVNWTPSIMDYLQVYMQEYDEAMFRLQSKLELEKLKYETRGMQIRHEARIEILSGTAGA